MDASTPRLAGLTLRAAGFALRLRPIARVLSNAVVEKKMREIDFAKEGDPAPFYMPRSYGK